MLLDTDALWLAQTNTYVVAREAGGPAVVIDAPPDPAGVVSLLAAHDLSLTGLLVTHGHVDHVGGAAGVEERMGGATYIHPDDDFLTLDPARQVRAIFGFSLPGDYRVPTERIPIGGGDIVELAGLSFEVRHTPGHTPGHCCFYLKEEGWLFSGDQLFAGSIGRTDLPGGSFPRLMESMTREIMVLDDGVRVLPGHGPETTIGRERRTNPFLR